MSTPCIHNSVAAVYRAWLFLACLYRSLSAAPGRSATRFIAFGASSRKWHCLIEVSLVGSHSLQDPDGFKRHTRMMRDCRGPNLWARCWESPRKVHAGSQKESTIRSYWESYWEFIVVWGLSHLISKKDGGGGTPLDRSSNSCAASCISHGYWPYPKAKDVIIPYGYPIKLSTHQTGILPHLLVLLAECVHLFLHEDWTGNRYQRSSVKIWLLFACWLQINSHNLDWPCLVGYPPALVLPQQRARRGTVWDAKCHRSWIALSFQETSSKMF